MELPDALPQRFCALAGGLDDHLAFGFPLDAPFPAVNGFHRRQEVDARGKPLLDQRLRKSDDIGVDGKSGQDENVFNGHVERSLIRSRRSDETIVQGTRPSMPQPAGPNQIPGRSADTPPLRRRRAEPAPPGPSPLRNRILNYVLALITVVLVVDALVGDKGLLETVRARRQFAGVEAALAATRQENARLREQVRRLKEDPASVEAIAREELGLIRPGEMLFIVHDSDGKKK